MRQKVTVVDYGMGNLFSVARAFEHCGAEVTLTSDATAIAGASRLVLPGVGAFKDGMAGLRARGLVEPIRGFARSGRPLLGICLGMQMLLDVSEEFGEHEGLGLVAGRVAAIPTTGIDGKPHKIPHIGWSDLVLPAGRPNWENTILRDLTPGVSAYFVHSFTADPADPGHRLADCLYNGRLISAAVQAGAIFGCQFHPEKSGETGLRIVRNFIGQPHMCATSAGQ